MCCDITTGPCAPCDRAPASADLTRLGSQVAKNVLVLLIMIDDCAVKGGYPHGKIHLYVISCHSTHLHVHFCCLCVKNEYILRKIKAFLFETCRNCDAVPATHVEQNRLQSARSCLNRENHQLSTYAHALKFPAFSHILLASCEKDRTRRGTHAHGATMCNY